MDLSNIITLFTGVALFLFGMSLMGDSLKRLAGGKLEVVLSKMTNSTPRSVALGAGVTAVIQSSSATSIMAVGFVNSGIIKFKQAIGVVLGAILGTSITGWIVSLSTLNGGSGLVQLISSTTIACVAALVGIYLRMFTKRRTNHAIGDILLGFAVLMVGMSLMSNAVAPLKESPTFVHLLSLISNPFLGILVGVAISSVLQSASAAVGLVQALTATDAVDFAVALPLIIGIAIGAALPVLIATIGATRDGKKTASIYLIANVLGAIIIGAAYYILNSFLQFSINSVILNTVDVALLNTVYRLLVVLALIPLVGFMDKITEKIVPYDKPSKNLQAYPEVHMEESFLLYTSLAIAHCKDVTNNMANLSRTSVNSAIDMLFNYNEKAFQEISTMEARSDQYEDAIGSYLLKVTKRELNTAQNKEISELLHTLPDLERITDYAMSMGFIAKTMYEKNINYSEQAKHELQVLRFALSELLDLTVDSFVNSDLQMAAKVEPLKDVVGKLCDVLKSHHVERLKIGTCTVEQGFTFNDILTSYERIAGHCSNVALAMLEIDSNAYDTHGHVRKIDPEHRKQFEMYVEQYTRKYALDDEETIN
jgi:phosphate:Na+ symporter